MAMSIASQLGASLTGNIEQAYLVVSDYRQKCGGKPGGKDAGLKAMNFFRKKASVVKNASYPGLVNPSADSPEDFGSYNKTFKVPFNPSQLIINASNLPMKKTDALGNDPANDSVLKAQLTMTVTLFFDEMNVYDSFMAEKFTGGITAQGAKNIATAVMPAKKKVWSVQDEVEGLVSALRNPFTRNISFRWADFVFTGQLCNISAQYTMFSTSGRPVRAKAVLRIQHEMDDLMLTSWYKDYETAFSGAGNSLVGAAQKVGNLVNLSL